MPDLPAPGGTGPASTGPEGAVDVAGVAGELEDALYYLRRGCQPCARRHLDLARRLGATAGQIEAVLAAGQRPG